MALHELNFRDLGGIEVSGGRVRSGKIYRSEGPASFEAPHHEALHALNIRLVCDLRSPDERAQKANDWTATARLLNIDVGADLRNRTNEGWELLRAEPNAASARAAMFGNYRAAPAALRPHFAGLVDAIVADETPLLVHCSAGKDRTGVLIALLLRLVGASEEAVLQDYLLSERFARSPRGTASVRRWLTSSFGLDPDEGILQAIMGVDPDYLAATFETIASECGSTEAWFSGAGIDDARRTALVQTLVDPV